MNKEKNPRGVHNKCFNILRGFFAVAEVAEREKTQIHSGETVNITDTRRITKDLTELSILSFFSLRTHFTILDVALEIRIL